MLPGTTSHRASSQGPGSIRLPAPTTRQITLGRGVQLQTPLPLPIRAGLVQTLCFPRCVLASRCACRCSSPGSSGAGGGTAPSRLWDGLLRAAMDALSPLPFSELSPTEASEGPTSRTLTALVQDGESKLRGRRLQGPVLAEGWWRAVSPARHPLSLHGAPRLSGSEGQSPGDPVIVPAMAKPCPRGSPRLPSARLPQSIPLYPAVSCPVSLPSWALPDPGSVASLCRGACGDLPGKAMSFSPPAATLQVTAASVW